MNRKFSITAAYRGVVELLRYPNKETFILTLSLSRSTAAGTAQDEGACSGGFEYNFMSSVDIYIHYRNIYIHFLLKLLDFLVLRV